MFPSFDFFCNVMDQCTENYECLVINNNAKSNKLEDQVFWYKAEAHPDFRMGGGVFYGNRRVRWAMMIVVMMKMVAMIDFCRITTRVKRRRRQVFRLKKLIK